ncbi:protein glass-like [Engraulis encrasicolus]|uniref:protein glass-like n=1 Tax=Engraulis encrasicolus TaxID=184585 RepID=UPI002FD2E164
MTHVSHGAIQSQLGAIMDVLTKAAVAEILQLFDDGSAVMRLEISRHQSENADLKRRLVEVKAQLRSVQIRLKANDSVVRQDWTASFRTERPDLNHRDSHTSPGLPMEDKCIVVEDQHPPDLMQIKEERLEEEMWNEEELDSMKYESASSTTHAPTAANVFPQHTYSASQQQQQLPSAQTWPTCGSEPYPPPHPNQQHMQPSDAFPPRPGQDTNHPQASNVNMSSVHLTYPSQQQHQQSSNVTYIETSHYGDTQPHAGPSIPIQATRQFADTSPQAQSAQQQQQQQQQQQTQSFGSNLGRTFAGNVSSTGPRTHTTNATSRNALCRNAASTNPTGRSLSNSHPIGGLASNSHTIGGSAPSNSHPIGQNQDDDIIEIEDFDAVAMKAEEGIRLDEEEDEGRLALANGVGSGAGLGRRPHQEGEEQHEGAEHELLWGPMTDSEGGLDMEEDEEGDNHSDQSLDELLMYEDPDQTTAGASQHPPHLHPRPKVGRPSNSEILEQQQQQYPAGHLHMCSICKRGFTTLPYLRKHLRSHSGERPFTCTICYKHFLCSSHLNIHLRTHTGERPYQCNTCGKCFTQQSSLKTHQSVHSGLRPYSCPHCGKSYTLQHHLKRHMATHDRS